MSVGAQKSLPSRKTILTSIGPYMTQVSGKPRSLTTRNISLVSHEWFTMLMNWLHNENAPEPGRIINAELYNKIQSNKEIVEGLDFEIIEINVFDALIKTFGGDHYIKRPYLFNPVTNTSSVVIKPIKIDIEYNSLKTTKTVDPNWSLGVLKQVFCSKLGLEHTKFFFQDSVTYQRIPEALLMGYVAANYNDAIRLVLINGSEPIHDYGKLEHTTSSRSMRRRLDSVPSFGSSLSGSDSETNSQFSSVLNSFFHCLAFIPSFTNLLNTSTRVKLMESNNQLISAFINFINETLSTKKVVPFPVNINSTINLIYPRFKIVGVPDSIKFLDQFLLDLIKEARMDDGSRIPLSGLVGCMVSESECSKCHAIESEVRQFSVLTLPLNKRFLLKTTFADCFKDFADGEKKERICQACSVKTVRVVRKRITKLPDVLVLHLPRFASKSTQPTKNLTSFKIEESLDIGRIAFGKERNALFSLQAVVAHLGGLPNVHHRGMVRAGHRSWLCINRAGLHPVNLAAAASPENAHTIVYVRDQK